MVPTGIDIGGMDIAFPEGSESEGLHPVDYCLVWGCDSLDMPHVCFFSAELIRGALCFMRVCDLLRQA